MLVQSLFSTCSELVSILVKFQSYRKTNQLIAKLIRVKNTINFSFKMECIIGFLSGPFSGFSVSLQEFSCRH